MARPRGRVWHRLPSTERASTASRSTGSGQAIDYTLAILDGEVPPAEVVLETDEVTAENAEALLAQYGGGGDAATPAP